MTDLPLEQQSATWSAVAAGYDAAFAGYTGRYSDDMVELVGIDADDQVLDVAAGSGAFTLRAARLGACVTATDFAPGMVELLRSRLGAAGHDRCDARVMDGQALEYPDGTFDHVVSMFGVIFFPDIDAGLRGMARVTRPGGRVGVATWDVARFRLTDLVREAINRTLPDLGLPERAPLWYRVGEAEGLAAAMTDAGLDPVEVTPVTHHWTWADPEGFFTDLPAWSPPTQPLFAVLDESQVGACAAEFGRLVGDGIDATALLAVGTRP